MKSKKYISIISVTIILLVLGYIVLKNIDSFKNDNIKTEILNLNIKYKDEELVKYVDSSINKNDITINSDNKKCVYENNHNLEILFNNNQNEYRIEYGVEETNKDNIITSEDKLNINVMLTEGLNKIKINIYKEEEIIYKYEKDTYYIKPYKMQFLEELSKVGISTHFIPGYDDFNESYELLKSIGAKTIRNSIRWEVIENLNGEYDFSTVDEWIKKVKEANISVMTILLSSSKAKLGNDYQISNETELNNFSRYMKEIIKKYPEIKDIEIWNEPNISWVTENSIKWYAKMNEIVKTNVNGENINIVSGATAVPYDIDSTALKSEYFLNKISQHGAYRNSDVFSYHIYENSNNMNWLIHTYINHETLIRYLGGFQRLYVSEYGIKDTNNQDNVDKILKQTVKIEELGIDKAILYNFIDDNRENNFGLVKNDYTPKPSYYSMKNYYENTNGSEYIGTVDIAEGLEAHVYNKDGKPKIIAWSNNSDKNIEIDYSDFTAKDIYGNNIENTNRKLTITTSPVYLDNISEKYYYLAISKTANEKYNEFENKYIEEIKAVTNLNTNIQTMKKYMTEVGNVTLGVPEDSAKKAIQQHYSLGKNILDAYKNEELKVEHVKLSSMLDSLEDIGNSYEDLVTVSAKTRNSDLDKANDQIKEVENIINSNTDLEIIYPSKILEFSKDYYEKATYINGLEEENDIKTGLIVSKNMHSIELSNWAKEFCEIYINEHIKNNPITTSYSQTEITNKDVQVTLNISEDCKINNNNGKKEYTFKENGEFTFEYTRRGKELSEKVVLNNIDKKSPEIKGVEQWKVYTKEVTPTVTDENIEKVELILNGQTVNGYNEGTPITEEGIYQIIATDKAGNISRVNFEVIEDIEKGYKIENGFIKNITGSTKRTDFENQLPIKYKYTIKREEKELDTNGIVATGDILETEGKEKYTLIVNGDINKDGIVSILDLVKIKRHILGEIKLEGIEKQAADANQDGKEIGIKDLVRMRILILSRGINN